MLCYTYTHMYRLYVHKTYSVYIYTFENEFFPTTTVQQRQQVDAVGCPTLISFGILQNLVGADRFVLDELHPLASLAQGPG